MARTRRLGAWGFEGQRYDPSPALLEWLADRLGPAEPFARADPAAVALPPARALPSLGAAPASAERRDRLAHARGQGLPDLLRIRSGRIAAAPDAVLRPGDDGEVAAALAACAASGVLVVPWGGGTSVTGGANAPGGGRALEEAAAILCERGGVGLGERPGRRWLADRYRHPYLRDALLDRGVAVETVETAAPWSRLAALAGDVRGAIEGALARAGERGAVLCHVSHAYADGASLYFTLFFRCPPDPDAAVARWAALKRAATGAMVEGQGTLSHHHGVGAWHAPWLAREIGEGGVRVLRAVAGALDPAGVMNPRALLDPEDRLERRARSRAAEQEPVRIPSRRRPRRARARRSAALCPARRPWCALRSRPPIERVDAHETTAPLPRPLVVGLSAWSFATFAAWFALPFVAAGTARAPVLWAHAAVLLVGLLVHGRYVARRNPRVLARRRRIGGDTKRWDLLWVATFWPLMASIAVVAAGDHAAHAGATLPLVAWPAGLAAFAAAMRVSARAMVANPFFEGTVRIQRDVGQYVVDTGPYRIVRHPGYVGLAAWALASPLLLLSARAFAPALAAAAWVALRTALEDATLRRELPGYADYARRVRSRLVPGVW